MLLSPEQIGRRCGEALRRLLEAARARAGG
jgi:hypothetical protein